jgi:hypothetical protein
MASFKSEENNVPEVDLRKLDHIVALVITFEQKDLNTKGVVCFYYDKKHEYVFLEVTADVNNRTIMDDVMGFDKEKVINLCKNVIDYFEKKNI